MKSKYRFVYFTPDPFMKEKFILGALFWVQGKVTFVTRRKPHCAKCLGGKPFLAIVNMITKDLQMEPVDFFILPGSCGPHISLGAIQTCFKKDKIETILKSMPNF